MDDFSFIRIHRLKSDVFLRLDHLGSQAISQLFQRLLPFRSIIFRIDHNFYILFTVLVHYKAVQILDRIQSLSALANDRTGIFAVHLQINDIFSCFGMEVQGKAHFFCDFL